MKKVKSPQDIFWHCISRNFLDPYDICTVITRLHPELTAEEISAIVEAEYNRYRDNNFKAFEAHGID